MDALYEKSSIKVEKLLNATLNRYISFNDFSSNAPKEMYYQGFLNSVFSQLCEGSSIYHDYKSNLELGKGRADCAFYITPEDIEKDYKGIVIEIKAATSDNNKKDFAQKALSQIEDKEYAKSYLLSDDSLVSVNYYGIAFFGKKCSVVAKTITRDDD